MSSSIGGMREACAPFFQDPDRVKFRNLLKDNLGEFNHIDFKEAWIETPKLARIIIAMANSGGGGIVFGIQELADKSYIPKGLEELEDKTPVMQKLGKYLPEGLKYDILDFAYTESEYAALNGKKFQVILVHDSPRDIPFLPASDGEGITKTRIYVRGNTNADEATHEQIQEIITRRLSATLSTASEETFKNDLFQLKALYEQISPYHNKFAFNFTLGAALGSLYRSVPNPEYPEESFDKFIHRMIVLKKTIIENAVMNNDQRGR